MMPKKRKSPEQPRISDADVRKATERLQRRGDAGEREALLALDRLNEMFRQRRAREEGHAAADLRKMIEAPAPLLLRILLEAAIAGDVGAARFLVDHVMPIPRSAPLSTPVALTGTPAERAEQIATLLSSGKITVEESQALLAAVEAVQRVRDNGELVGRLTALERQLAALGQPARDVIDVEPEPAKPLPAPAKGEPDEF
jgi:hypothetical protein